MPFARGNQRAARRPGWTHYVPRAAVCCSRFMMTVNLEAEFRDSQMQPMR